MGNTGEHPCTALRLVQKLLRLTAASPTKPLPVWKKVSKYLGCNRKEMQNTHQWNRRNFTLLMVGSVEDVRINLAREDERSVLILSTNSFSRNVFRLPPNGSLCMLCRVYMCVFVHRFLVPFRPRRIPVWARKWKVKDNPISIVHKHILFSGFPPCALRGLPALSM